jgi:hypothetical protein
LELCSIKWERRIIEHELQLASGWNLNVTLPFISLSINDYGWDRSSLKERLFSKPSFYSGNLSVDMIWAGFGVGIQGDNLNTGELIAYGDYEMVSNNG